MQKIEKRIVWPGVMGVVCALLLTSIGCSEMGKRHITVNVESDPPGASVEALISGGLSGGTFSPGPLGTSPTGNKTMHFAFGALGAGGTKIGVRVSKPGFKGYEVFFTRDDCYSSAEEALKNVKHIFAKLTPEEREEQK